MTATPGQPIPDMQDLLAGVGRALLFWGHLEAVMEETLPLEDRGALRRHGGSATTTSLWRSTLEARPDADSLRHRALLDALDTVSGQRNLLAHGLWSAWADPTGVEPARVRCRDRSGELQDLTLADLIALAEQIEALTREIRQVDLRTA